MGWIGWLVSVDNVGNTTIKRKVCVMYLFHVVMETFDEIVFVIIRNRTMDARNVLGLRFFAFLHHPRD